MDKKRVIQWIAAAVCLLAVLCGIFFLRPKNGQITLINEASDSLIKITVRINQQKFDFANIPPGGMRKIKFKIESDNHYSATVEFHFERMLESQIGYFTDRQPNHQLVVKDEQVVLESGAD